MATKFEMLEKSLWEYANKVTKRSDVKPMDWLSTNEVEALKVLGKENPKTSPRTQILSYAIAAKVGIEHANELLKSRGYEALYIRNMNDMACMWALEKGGSASDVCQLYKELAEVIDIDGSAFISPDVSLSTIENYLNATPEYSDAEVGKMTAQLQQKFDYALLKGEAIVDVARDNSVYFTNMRDRSRREFLTIFHDYLSAIIANGNKDEIDGVLRTSQLRVYPDRTQPNSNNKKNIVYRIEDCKVNYTNFVTQIDDYFQGALLSSDWITDTGVSDSDGPSYDEYENMTPAEKAAFLDDIAPEEVEEKKRCTKCVKTIREFIQGKVDITRTFFIAAVLYMNTRLDNDTWLDLDSLNDVLQRCGWKQVQSVDPSGLDKLVMYLYENDPHTLGYTPHFVYDVMYDSLLADSMGEFADYAGFNPTKSRDETFGQALGGKR